MALAWSHLITITVSCLTVLVVSIMVFSRKNHFQIEGRTVVITGGSQGLGQSLAELLAKKGANVVIVARDVRKLKAAIEVIAAVAKSPTTQRFHHISADLTSPSENTRVLAEVTAWNANTPPDVVWANAGMAIPGLFLDTPIETLRAQMDTNYWTAAYLAHATLSAWTTTAAPSPLTTGDGGTTGSPPPQPRYFIATCSSIAFCGVAGYAPYAPAKSAWRSLHDTLRSELNLYNTAAAATSASGHDNTRSEIRIATVFPGTILTPGFDVENTAKHPVTKLLEKDDPAQTADEVARAAVSELEKGRRFFSTQIMGKAMAAGGMMGSVRDRGLVDALLGAVMSVVWVVVAWDMEGKVRGWARKNGVHGTVDGAQAT